MHINYKIDKNQIVQMMVEIVSSTGTFTNLMMNFSGIRLLLLYYLNSTGKKLKESSML